MPKRDADELLAIGRLGAPKGVKGDLKLQSYSGETAHFLGLKTARLRQPEAAASAAASAAGADDAAKGSRKLELKVQRISESGSGLIVAFVGYDSPEKARVLTGMEIIAPRSECAPLRENEWYITDLVGLSLVAEGRALATVRSVLEGGSDPWLEAIIPSGAGQGGAGRSALVPFRKEFVGEVDLEAGTIELLAPYLLEE